MGPLNTWPARCGLLGRARRVGVVGVHKQHKQPPRALTTPHPKVPGGRVGSTSPGELIAATQRLRQPAVGWDERPLSFVGVHSRCVPLSYAKKGGCDMVLFTLPCLGTGAERI